MATWRAFAEQAPELAQAGERLFQEHEVAYLATTSPAGWPRLSPFCPAVAAGHLWAFIIEESPKRLDMCRQADVEELVFFDFATIVSSHPWAEAKR